MKKTAYETTLFSCKHWRRTNVDQAMFQPCMFAAVFVPRSFSFFVRSYLKVEALIRYANKHLFSLMLVWFKTRKH